jgi:zinc D-Ala-D-Ala carboxypeptidase
MIDWHRYPSFRPQEFRCRHTGELRMEPDFLDRLQRLRTAYARAMVITSGYRHPTHPIEANKGGGPGPHTTGRACDVAVSGAEALRLVALAVDYGFTGVGVAQKGDGRFIHLDDLDRMPQRPRPTIWSY